MRKLLLILTLFCATTLSAQEFALDSVAISGEAATDSVAISNEVAPDSVVISNEVASDSVVISEETTLVQPTSDCVKLDRLSGTYFLGDDPLTRKEYRDFLRVNAPDLYNRYRTGNALWATGWTLLGVSTAAFFFSGVCMVAGIFETVIAAMLGASSQVLLTTGLVIMGSSVALNIGAIPCLVYGGIYKFSAHTLYNERCERQQTTLELSLQTSQNGIGFALRF